jgi:hypothetical protein
VGDVGNHVRRVDVAIRRPCVFKSPEKQSRGTSCRSSPAVRNCRMCFLTVVPNRYPFGLGGGGSPRVKMTPPTRHASSAKKACLSHVFRQGSQPRNRNCGSIKAWQVDILIWRIGRQTSPAVSSSSWQTNIRPSIVPG